MSFFKVKYKVDGTTERYKARLVVNGLTQEERLNYFDKFSFVAKITTFRTIVAHVSSYNQHLQQFDINNAFSHGDLNEEIYIKSPVGNLPHNDTRICLLKKSLYVLKQASRYWFNKLASCLLSSGYTQTIGGSSLFVKMNNTNFTTLCVYVTDIIIRGNHLE